MSEHHGERSSGSRAKTSPVERVDALLNLLYEVGEDPTLRSELYSLIETSEPARARFVEAMALRTSLQVMLDETSSGIDSTLTMRRPPASEPRAWAYVVSIVGSVAATLLVTFVIQQTLNRDDAAVAIDVIQPAGDEPDRGVDRRPMMVQPKEPLLCARVAGMSLGMTEDIFAPDYVARAGDVITLPAEGGGWVRFATTAGSTLLVHGPAIGSFRSPTEFVLESGTVIGEDRSAGANKLGIRIGETLISDLGTRFGVSVDSAKKLNVEVFDGSVAVSTEGRVIAAQLEYGMGLTYRIGQDETADIHRLPDQPSLARLNEMMAGIVATDGDVRFNPFMPSSVAGGLSSDDGSIHIFEELGSFTLDEPIQVSRLLGRDDVGETPIVCSGDSERVEQAPRLLTEQPLRSFLMHFENASGTRAAGYVEFDRPIVAVIGDADLLMATDGVAGRGSVTYPNMPDDKTRGVESDAARAEANWRDALTVSHGRTRLNVDLIVGHGVDQMRILVDAR